MDKEQFLRALRAHFGLTETVNIDDSYEAQRHKLEMALHRWPDRPEDGLEVAFTFADRLVAVRWRPSDEGGEQAWEIPWQREGDDFTFGSPVPVQRVVRYEDVTPKAVNESKGQRIAESIEQRLVTLAETSDGGRRIKAIGVSADVVNANKRRYSRPVLQRALQQLNSHLHESAGQGRLIATGEAEHPSDKTGRPRVLETVVKWEAASLTESGNVLLEGVILPTSKGRDLIILVDNKVPIGISQRGYGHMQRVTEGGTEFDEVTELTITGWDIVEFSQKSDPTAQILESKERQMSDKPVVNDKPDTSADEVRRLKAELEAKEKLLAESAKAQKEQSAEEVARLRADVKAKEEQLAEAGKLKAELEAKEKELTEARKAEAELAERKQREAIDSAIAEATVKLPYGDRLNPAFVEAVKAADPESPDAVAAIVEAKRKEWDAIFSAVKLNGMGKVDVLGPVFEKETGQPEFTRAAYAINESLVKAGQGHGRDLAKAAFGAELFAAQYLETFDAQFRRQLVAEARLFQEAETTTDLDLPYSVMRAVVQQAFPELVAANVFDFRTTDQSPTRIYFEQYQGESGSTATVTDEAVTADSDAWVDLDNARLQPGTVVVTNNAADTTYVEGDDYVIDYGKGRIMALSGGDISDSQALKVDYIYDAIRKGEMQPIERAKQVLSHKLLEIAADRLATQISSEAVVFSRSQLGYDAVTSTLAGLVKQIRIKIDRDIFYLAVAASLQQANNSGGTWNSATDTLDKLVEYIGYAKVKVYGRYYTPTAILMSKANSDVLSNWSGFKNDGFPNAMLNAAGFAGSVKGLPIWSSTEFPDSYILTPNQQLVMHRVYQAMMLKGPFPSYDSNGKIIAADQYYAEEYNGTDVPVVEKVAHVKVA